MGLPVPPSGRHRNDTGAPCANAAASRRPHLAESGVIGYLFSLMRYAASFRASNLHVAQRAALLPRLLKCFAFAFGLLLLSCGAESGAGDGALLTEEELFRINYGLREDELNILSLFDGADSALSLCMRSGFFYILNGDASRIIKTNSYGDLLAVFYNEDVSPKPDFPDNDGVEPDTGAKNTTKISINYNFNSITDISVDSRQYLYVLSRLPAALQETDSENNMVLSQVILRFDDKGRPLAYIGQEGARGTPFGHVKNIFTTSRDELVVVSDAESGFCVYWYDSAGALLYRIPAGLVALPNPYSESGRDIFYSLENIVPDTNQRVLYFKVDYFENYVDEGSNISAGVNYIGTQVHPCDAETGIFRESITIAPRGESGEEVAESGDMPYDLLGCSEGGWLCFMLRRGDEIHAHFVNAADRVAFDRVLSASDDPDSLYVFDLSREGIISALEIKEDYCSVVWWRADRAFRAAGAAPGGEM